MLTQRWLLLVALLATIATPCWAAKRVTVAQLEQMLTADYAGHKSEEAILKQIGGLELSEQLTDATLNRLSTNLKMRPEVMLALQLLADRSAFLDPPLRELPAGAAPDEATQQAMLQAARAYGAQALPRLPNLIASRTTIRYDNTPQALKQGEWPVRAGLHRVDTSVREISVWVERDHEGGNNASQVWGNQTGLTTGGEFGSVLAMILADTEHGNVKWSHWEQGTTAPIAVFQYLVPRPASHYEVIGSVERQAAVEGIAMAGSTARGTAGIAARPSSAGSSRTSVERNRAGYHGSLWVEPTTGTILRITLEADTRDSASFRHAAILVEYGPVQIGGSNFICPVRSLALSEAIPDAQVLASEAPTEWLNETLFTAYHRFGSTVRILPGSAPPGSAQP